MVIPPIHPLTQALHLAPVAREVASTVSNTFSSLLRSSVGNSPKKSTSRNVSGPHSPVNDPHLDLTAVRWQNNSLINAFHLQVQQFLAGQGIDLASGINLQLDELGKIRVAGRHPDSQQIENLIATQPELADQLQFIAANSRLLNAADEAKSFQKLYAMDPAAAVANSPHLFSENASVTFDLFLDAQRTEVSFQRPMLPAGR
jgi:hypothetical protein